MNILLSPYLNPHCISYLNPYPSPYPSLYSNPGPRLILTSISYGSISKYPVYFWSSVRVPLSTMLFGFRMVTPYYE